MRCGLQVGPPERKGRGSPRPWSRLGGCGLPWGRGLILAAAVFRTLQGCSWGLALLDVQMLLPGPALFLEPCLGNAGGFEVLCGRDSLTLFGLCTQFSELNVRP